MPSDIPPTLLPSATNTLSKCYLTISGDWWYAHINSKGHMTGIHFTNDTNTVPDTGATFDFTKQ